VWKPSQKLLKQIAAAEPKVSALPKPAAAEPGSLGEESTAQREQQHAHNHRSMAKSKPHRGTTASSSPPVAVPVVADTAAQQRVIQSRGIAGAKSRAPKRQRASRAFAAAKMIPKTEPVDVASDQCRNQRVDQTDLAPIRSICPTDFSGPSADADQMLAKSRPLAADTYPGQRPVQANGSTTEQVSNHEHSARKQKQRERQRRLLATGLPEYVTTKRATEFFKRFGAIKQIKFSRDVNRRKQVLIHFQSRKSVTQVMLSVAQSSAASAQNKWPEQFVKLVGNGVAPAQAAKALELAEGDYGVAITKLAGIKMEPSSFPAGSAAFGGVSAAGSVARASGHKAGRRPRAQRSTTGRTAVSSRPSMHRKQDPRVSQQPQCAPSTAQPSAASPTATAVGVPGPSAVVDSDSESWNPSSIAQVATPNTGIQYVHDNYFSDLEASESAMDSLGGLDGQSVRRLPSCACIAPAFLGLAKMVVQVQNTADDVAFSFCDL
jgi:hypothetical protein